MLMKEKPTQGNTLDVNEGFARKDAQGWGRSENRGGICVYIHITGLKKMNHSSGPGSPTLRLPFLKVALP